MSDFRFQPWPGTIAITTLLEFCSWLALLGKGGGHIRAGHSGLAGCAQESLYSERIFSAAVA